MKQLALKEPGARIEILKREKQAFERIKPDLLKQYRGRAVAIHQEKLVGISAPGESLADLAVRVYRQVGYIPIYFGIVDEVAPRTYKFPYFKKR